MVGTQPDPVAIYRDDGPIARALGAAGSSVRLPAPALVLAGFVPLLVVTIVRGGELSYAAAAAVVAWVVVTGGVSSGVTQRARIAWAGPPLVRASEYVALIWIAALHGASAYPAAFAVIFALQFRHYDLVYRFLHGSAMPARWVSALSLGWDGRVVLAYLLLVAGVLPAGFYVAAAVLAVAFVGEAVYGWAVIGRVEQPLGDEDEENEL